VNSSSRFTRDMNVSDEVDFEELAEETGEASGADIKAITTEAGMFAIRDDRKEVWMQDFIDAWDKIKQTETESDEVSKTFA
jgi:proteasome regulatory subunit